MELKVKEVTLPEVIEFNYQELKNELEKKISVYSTLVYTDDEIKQAKADKANLNKLKKALNDERIRREKEYMKPFNDFKTKINEIIGIIDKPVAVIDSQVREYEQKQKQDKLQKIQEFFNTRNFPDYITLENIMNEKWLNASVSMKSVQEAIVERETKEIENLETLSNLPEFGFEATEVYKTTLDINKALNEGRRLSEIAKKKAEHEEAMRKIAEEQKAKVAKEEQVEGQVEFTDAKSFDENVLKPAQEGFMNPPIEEAPAKQWVRFQAFITVEQAKELKQFFDDRNIEFKAV